MKYLLSVYISLLLFVPLSVYAKDIDGTVKSIGMCKQQTGDKRYCKSMLLKLKNKKDAHALIVLDTAIHHADGIYYDSNEGDMPQSDADNIKSLDDAIRKYLKSGTKVKINATCGDEGCVATKITVK